MEKSFPEKEKTTWKVIYSRLSQLFFVLLSSFFVLVVPGYLLGAVFGRHYYPGPFVVWTSGFFCGFFVMALFLYIAGRLEDEYMASARKYCRELEKEHNHLLDEFNRVLKEDLEKRCQTLYKVLEDFYADSPITDYLIQQKGGHLSIRIGDEERMIDIDPKLLFKDVVGELERARLEWMAENES